MAVTSFCTSCGTQLEPGDTFCVSCGTAVEDPDQTAAPAAQPVEAAPATQPMAAVPAATVPAPVATPAPVEATAAPAATTYAALPEGQFKAEDRWWFRKGDRLLVHQGGQWIDATRVPVMDAAAAGSTAPVRYGALLGATAVGVSALLAWVAVAGLPATNGFDVPVGVLIDATDETAEKGFDIGWLFLALGIAGAALSFRPALQLPRRAVGGAAVLVAGLFAFQLQRSINMFGADAPSVFDFLGIGVFLAIGGGVVLALDR